MSGCLATIDNCWDYMFTVILTQRPSFFGFGQPQTIAEQGRSR